MLDEASAAARDEQTGVALVVINTEEGSGRRAFFDAVRAAVTLNPPIVSERSWDALSDSFWQAIWELPETDIEVRWRGASHFERVSPEDYEIALGVLVHVAESLARVDLTGGSPKDVRVRLA